VRGVAAGAAQTAASRTGSITPRRRRPVPAARVAVAWLAGAGAAFPVYLRLARTRAVNSDGASQALQAWDMLHGNPLLRGWTVSDVSFYTTELPQYALVELFRGLRADVVDIAAAMAARWRSGRSPTPTAASASIRARSMTPGSTRGAPSPGSSC
jgi:hypothetical protein